MNLEKELEIYKKQGYVRIKNVFDEKECAQIKAEAYEELIKCPDDHPRLQWKNKKPALLFWPQDYNQFLRKIVFDPKMKKIVYQFLGTKEVRQINNQIYFRESGDGDQFAWHQDICFRTPPQDFHEIEANYIQTVIAVDPIKDNGAIEFIPGSHYKNLNLIPRDNSELGLRKFVRGDWKGEKVVAHAGDVLVWNLLVVHGSEENISERSRMTYMSGFAAEKSVLNKHSYPEY